MADGIGEFNGERFFCDLRLIVVVGFLVGGVVGSGFVGGLGDDEGIAGGIDRGGFIAGGDAGGIGLGVVGEARGRESREQEGGEDASERQPGSRSLAGFFSPLRIPGLCREVL